jgi:hypothetical protein
MLIGRGHLFISHLQEEKFKVRINSMIRDLQTKIAAMKVGIKTIFIITSTKL